MTEPRPYLAEAMSAARGVVAIILGDRKAPDWFDLTLQGLVGSLIAFMVVTGFNAYLPVLMGVPGAAGSVFESALIILLMLGLQAGISLVVLRQMQKPEGFVPYLVTYNWANVVLTLATMVLAVGGLGGEMLLLGVGILVIVVTVNIGRVILKLGVAQIILFLIAQLVAGGIGLIVLRLFLGPAEAPLPQ